MRHVSANACEGSLDLILLENNRQKIFSMTWEQVGNLVREKGVELSSEMLEGFFNVDRPSSDESDNLETT